ncbi:MAG: CapA family protein [Candidatus Yonathbacteria bacterium]|nr:CapA family protein [Candidatus Yonathbacteria bacterium]
MIVGMHSVRTLLLFGMLGAIPALLLARPELVVSPIQRMKIEKKPSQVTLVAVGDVMLSRAVAERMRAHGVDYPFSETRDSIIEADIAFANLETPLVTGRTIAYGEMTFRADPESAGALARAGFDIVSLANNHTTNFGPEGLLATFRYLSDVGVFFIGAGKSRDEAYAPVLIERNGTTFAFLAYTYAPDTYGLGSSPDLPGLAGLDTERMIQAVRTAKESADVVVVSMHAGDEYATEPSDVQKEFAHAAIDAGASLVIGHHPHVLQPSERYHDGLILYSLGNFIFDQITPETQQSVIARVTFTDGVITETSFLPVIIEDLSRPRILEGEEGETIVKRIGNRD